MFLRSNFKNIFEIGRIVVNLGFLIHLEMFLVILKIYLKLVGWLKIKT